MSFIGELLNSMERSSAGSVKTAQQALALCGDIKPETALFVGDDLDTPALIKEKFGCELTAAFSDSCRADKAALLGMNASAVQLFELPQRAGGYDFVWYNGAVEFDGAAQRLSQIREVTKRGGMAVFRSLCWLIDPSPDTRVFCERRFGKIKPLDKNLITIRESGFKPEDFYIAPRSDWTENFYKPLIKRAEEYVGASNDAGARNGLAELRKEADIFELHCEEYSYVYYIMKG
ncbi:MAG: hypothetical protein ACI4KM_01005 [Oscillospiraceae bacterium]